jgi:Fe-S cluster assembly protein SufD
MVATSPEIEPYVAQFERLMEKAAGSEPAWLTSLRREAINHFRDLGFPTTRDEEWKYTDVGPIARTAFRPAPDHLHADLKSLIESVPLASAIKNRLVFVNGRYVSEYSHIEGLPAGVRVVNLAEAVRSEAHALEHHLGRYAGFKDRAFTALNTALWQDGAHVYIPRGVVVEEPIHLLYVTTAEDAPIVTNLRTLIVAEENSQATVIETYAGPDGQTYFNNAVTEIDVAENAVLDHYKVELERSSAYHIATQQTQHASSANFMSHNLCLGGLLVRNDVNSVLGGEGIESTINGLYLTGGRQHVDNHTAIDHAMPHCNSHELYKGIMDGKSTAVFNGKIFVRLDAQKTDAKQTNQNLLLSRDASVDTKPQLEIFADDVRCTHGATIGQLDADALFYLRARGIGAHEARNLLVYAFAADLLERIKVDVVREELERLLYERLAQAGIVE